MERQSTTDREFEAVELIALFGMTKKEIAKKWTRSLHTVETTIKNAYKKIGASNSADATRWYFGYAFGMAQRIKEKQKEILHVLIISLTFYSTTPSQTDLRSRNSRRTRSITLEVRGSRLRSRRREIPMPLNDLSPNNEIAS